MRDRRIGYGENKVKNLQEIYKSYMALNKDGIIFVKRCTYNEKYVRFIVIRSNNKVIKREVEVAKYRRISNKKDTMLFKKDLAAYIGIRACELVIKSFLTEYGNINKDNFSEFLEYSRYINTEYIADIDTVRKLDDLVYNARNIVRIMNENKNKDTEANYIPNPENTESSSNIEIAQNKILVSEKEEDTLPDTKKNSSFVNIDSNGHVIIEEPNTQPVEEKPNIEIREEVDLDLEDELRLIDTRHKDKAEIIRRILEKPNEDRTEAERVYVFGKDYKKQDIDLSHKIVFTDREELVDLDEFEMYDQLAYIGINKNLELMDVLDAESASEYRMQGFKQFDVETIARVNCKLLLESDKKDWWNMCFMQEPEQDISSFLDDVQEIAEDQMGKIQENPEYEQEWLREKMAEWKKMYDEEFSDNSAISE